MKVAGIDEDHFEGPARVFEGEDAAMEAILGGRIEPGDVVVIRYEGPQGRPGDARDAGRHRSDEGCRQRRTPRWSRTAASRAVPTASAWSVAPEAVDGGPIAFVREGDRIAIDVNTHTIDIQVDPDELAQRVADWKLPEPRYTSGFLAKYARLAQAPRRARSPRPEQARPRDGRASLCAQECAHAAHNSSIDHLSSPPSPSSPPAAATTMTTGTRPPRTPPRRRSPPRLPRPTSRPGPRSRWRTPTSARSWSTAVA